MTLFALRWPCGAPSRTSPLSLLPLLLGGLLGVAEPCVAQNPPPPSQAQGALERAIEQNPGLADVLRQRIQQSGLTPEQVRALLQAGGYPSNLLDPYLSARPRRRRACRSSRPSRRSASSRSRCASTRCRSTPG